MNHHKCSPCWKPSTGRLIGKSETMCRSKKLAQQDGISSRNSLVCSMAHKRKVFKVNKKLALLRLHVDRSDPHLDSPFVSAGRNCRR